MRLSDGELDEPTSPGADLPDWWGDLVVGASLFIMATLTLEVIDRYVFRTDLPWWVCVGMGVVMVAGGWLVGRDAGMFHDD